MKAASRLVVRYYSPDMNACMHESICPFQLHQALANVLGSMLRDRNTANPIARCLDLCVSLAPARLGLESCPGRASFPFNSIFGLYAQMGSHSLII